MADTLAVLTYKSIDTCLDVGGTQSWRLIRAKALQCRYVVLCRNAHHPHVEGAEPHLSAFLVGRVGDVVPSTDHEGRWLVKFSEYAEVSVRNAYKGGRNPVSYTSLGELGINETELDFKPVPISDAEVEEPTTTKSPPVLTIATAKAGLAAAFGVKPEAVEIIIHG